jgi:hypothetical protein
MDVDVGSVVEIAGGAAVDFPPHAISVSTTPLASIRRRIFCVSFARPVDISIKRLL